MKYNSEQPSFHILICLIEVWAPKQRGDLDMPGDRSNVRMITECQNIEINESYSQLVGTAQVVFPRGTVLKKTITELNAAKYSSTLTVDTSDYGVVYETRTDSKKAEVTDFKIGDRIRISLGYTTDYKIANLTKPDKQGKSIYNNNDKLNDYRKHVKLMFDGYIKKVSLDTPIELQCEDLASGLKRVSCPKINLKSATVNTLLASDDTYKLLDKTGLKLNPKTAAMKIPIGGVNLDEDFTVADEILRWQDMGLYAFVVGKELHVRRLYFSNPDEDSILNTYPSSQASAKILFNYHVADNGLKLMDTTKDYLVVEGTSIGDKDKTYHVSIRLNPEWKEGGKDKDKYQIVNESTVSKKAKKMGVRALSKIKKHVDLSDYTKIQFIAKKRGISNEDLLQEAIKYFEGYNMNGIEGSLTLFGDLNIRTAMHVELVDERQSMKNGIYLVEEVTTRFGTDGYRQTIKLPYCLKRESKNKNNNE